MFRFSFLTLTGVWCLTTTQQQKQQPSSSTRRQIHVWDNVMDAPSRAITHQVAADAGLSHTLMIRRTQQQQEGRLTASSSPSSSSSSSALEYALESILQELNDTSPYVEYWCRQEWRHIEAHADVDEHRAKTTPNEDFRYPTNGHVLYLNIGPQVRGPTCLFPDCSTGGDLLARDDIRDDGLSVLTVPAVEGRLLRFPGHWLHAVPRPTDIWMLPFVQGSADFSSDFQRSVILFNTWNEEPPLNVAPRSTISTTTSSSTTTSTNNNNNHDVQDVCSSETYPPLVQKFSHWEPQEVVSLNSPSRSKPDKTKIWLLGDLKRRNYTLRTVPVYSNGDELRDALYEASQPRVTPLSPMVVE